MGIGGGPHPPPGGPPGGTPPPPGYPPPPGNPPPSGNPPGGLLLSSCGRRIVLRSRPTCHGIRRTVIDIARESLVFHFFCIILRLAPCRTGLFLITDLAPTSSRLIGLMT